MLSGRVEGSQLVPLIAQPNNYQTVIRESLPLLPGTPGP